MDTNINITTRLDTGQWSKDYTIRPQRPVEHENKPVTHAAVPPRLSTQQIQENLAESKEKATAAIGAVHQLTDLVVQVQEKLVDTTAGTGHIAQARLVQSARDTARDILDHVRTSTGPVFQAQAPNVGGLANRKAIGAYGQNQSAFQTSQSTDPPMLRHAMQHANKTLYGPDGVLTTLDKLDATSPKVEHDLQHVIDSLESVVFAFKNSLRSEIEPAQKGHRGSVPYDLAGNF